MSMTKKDYELIEDIAHRVGEYASARTLIFAMADEFQKRDPKFKRGLFLLQTGVSG